MEIIRDIEIFLPFLGAALIGGANFLVFSFLKKRALNIVEKKSTTKPTIKLVVLRQLLESTSVLFLAVFSIFLGAMSVHLGGTVNFLVKKAAFISLILLLGLWANVVITHGMELIAAHYHQKRGMSAAIFSMLRTLFKIAIWAILALFIMDNLNFQISTLIAGLGIGGIALALAVQNILQDLFASLSIIIDEPFLIGDLVAIDEYVGHVEYIGIKTTRIRSLGGELILFSNGDLLKSRMRNYKKMKERRVTFVLEVVYETPLEKVKKVPSIVKEIISRTERVRFERAHLKEFGSYSLNFEVVYYVLAPDSMTYMDVQQEINEKILERFESERIEFAYPTTKSIRV